MAWLARSLVTSSGHTLTPAVTSSLLFFKNSTVFKHIDLPWAKTGSSCYNVILILGEYPVSLIQSTALTLREVVTFLSRCVPSRADASPRRQFQYKHNTNLERGCAFLGRLGLQLELMHYLSGQHRSLTSYPLQ